MDVPVYEELHVAEPNCTGYTRTNQTLNAQQRNSIVRKTTTNRCIFIWIGIIFGSIISGIIVFAAIKYGGMSSCDRSSCFWTEWTEWTGCTSLLNLGEEKRVQSYTGYAHNCQQKEIAETRICNDRTLDIRFDPITFYSTCFLSVDHKILSNRYTDRTPYNPRAGNRFLNYQGAMANTCVEKSTSIYYEIYFQYVITSTLSKTTYLVLELGIGERNKIDNHYFVGHKNGSGWAFCLSNCKDYDRVCLTAQNKFKHEYVIKSFSSNTAGTRVHGTFGILIDRERNKFSLIYNDNVLFTFHDVLSNVSLCPVFGVYMALSGEVSMQIVSVGNITLKF